MKGVEAKSYGIISVFKNEGNFHIPLVKNSKGGHWGLPKGTPEKGEEPIETAKRELFEETGIKDIKVKESPTFEERYSFEQEGVVYDKINTYFLGFVNNMVSGGKLDGIDEIKWVEIDKAKNVLTYQSAIDVVDELSKYLNK